MEHISIASYPRDIGSKIDWTTLYSCLKLNQIQMAFALKNKNENRINHRVENVNDTKHEIYENWMKIQMKQIDLCSFIVKRIWWQCNSYWFAFGIHFHCKNIYYLIKFNLEEYISSPTVIELPRQDATRVSTDTAKWTKNHFQAWKYTQFENAWTCNNKTKIKEMNITIHIRMQLYYI